LQADFSGLSVINRCGEYIADSNYADFPFQGKFVALNCGQSLAAAACMVDCRPRKKKSPSVVSITNFFLKNQNPLTALLIIPLPVEVDLFVANISNEDKMATLILLVMEMS